MKKKPINPKEASVAAAFFEPVYQRLRQWHNGRAINLLCFVHETSSAVQAVLDECGAKRSDSFRARCFAEIWEVPDDKHLATLFQGEACGLDKRLSEAMGCLGGRYSAATGNLLWGDIREADQRRHYVSRLLQESLEKKGHAR